MRQIADPLYQHKVRDRLLVAEPWVDGDV